MRAAALTMLTATDTRIAPWHIVRSDDEGAARLNTIAHVLSSIPHKKRPVTKLRLPLTAAAARSLLIDLVDGRANDALSSAGTMLWQRDYPDLLAAAYPDLRPLLP